MNNEELYRLIGTVKYSVSDEYMDFICGNHPAGYKRTFGDVEFEIVEAFRKANFDGLEDSYDSYEPSSHGILEVIYRAGDKLYREVGRYNSYETDWAGLGKPVEMVEITRIIKTYKEAE